MKTNISKKNEYIYLSFTENYSTYAKEYFKLIPLINSLPGNLCSFCDLYIVRHVFELQVKSLIQSFFNNHNINIKEVNPFITYDIVYLFSLIDEYKVITKDMGPKGLYEKIKKSCCFLSDNHLETQKLRYPSDTKTIKIKKNDIENIVTTIIDLNSYLEGFSN